MSERMEKEWKCGKCGKEYTSEEWRSLKSVQLVPEDTDPMRQHGYTGVCPCGYVFHRDKWHIRDVLELPTDHGRAKVEVITYFLELRFRGGWYETDIFDEGGDVKMDSHAPWKRYETQEEAEQEHNELVRLLREGKYAVKVAEVRVELLEQG